MDYRILCQGASKSYHIKVSKHGYALDIFKSTKTLAFESTPKISSKDLSPLIHEHLPPLVDTLVSKAREVDGNKVHKYDCRTIHNNYKIECFTTKAPV